MKSRKEINYLQTHIQKALNIRENTTINPSSTFSHLKSKSRSFKTCENALQTSFQLQAKSEHAQQIWNSSLRYVHSCFIVDNFIIEDGLNDQRLFSNSFDFDEPISDLQDILTRNKLLSNQQIQQYCLDLNSEKHLKKLLQDLSNRYREDVLQQIIYVSHWAWEKYLQLKQSTKANPLLAQMNLSTVFNFHQQIQAKNVIQYLDLNCIQILKCSEKVSEEISGLIFLDKKIKFINLMQAQIPKNKINIRDEFKKFIEEIVKAIYYCLEGYYVQPNKDEVTKSEEILLSDFKFSEGQSAENKGEDLFQHSVGKKKKLNG